MPRYYCDYCDTYLTHDSPSVRKQHNAGYKHKANVRAYYQQFEEQQTQSLIDQKIKEHLGHTAAVYQMGGAFHHLTALGNFKPSVTLPVLPIPGSTSASLPSIRPPVLPVPAMPTAASSVGYGSTTVATQFRVPPPRPPGITAPPGHSGGSTMMQPNGLSRPLVLPPPPGASSAPGPPGVPEGTVARSTSIGANGPTPLYNNTSLQQSSIYRNQSYNPHPGTTPSYPQQVGPPSVATSQHSQQRGLSQTPGSQSSYGYGPPPHAPYSGPTSGAIVPYRN